MGFNVGLDIGALAGGAMTAGGSILQGYWNKQQQQNNLDYQKDLQARIFEREDDSVQRRVADLKKLDCLLLLPLDLVLVLVVLYLLKPLKCQGLRILVSLLRVLWRLNSLSRKIRILAKRQKKIYSLKSNSKN